MHIVGPIPVRSGLTPEHPRRSPEPTVPATPPAASSATAAEVLRR